MRAEIRNHMARGGEQTETFLTGLAAATKHGSQGNSEGFQ
jgi:hypothetical protein